MIISMPNLVAMLTVGQTFLAAGPDACAFSPLTLPSPPPQRPWLWHEEQSAGERGESTPRLAHLPTSGPTTISLTALLTHLLTDLLIHSLSTLSNCAKGSRARRNLHPSIGLRHNNPNGLIKQVGVCAWKCVPGPEGRGHSNRSIGTGIPLA